VLWQRRVIEPKRDGLVAPLPCPTTRWQQLCGLTGATSYANELEAVTAVSGSGIALRLDWRGEFEDPMAAAVQ
jgi:hypothetical protein